MPDGTRRLPHYVKFVFDEAQQQHSVIGTRDDLDNNTSYYGWPLQAAPFLGPSTEHANNADLDLLLGDEGARLEVDISLATIDDKGLTADVNRHRHVVDEEAILRQREEELRRDWSHVAQSCYQCQKSSCPSPCTGTSPSLPD